MLPIPLVSQRGGHIAQHLGDGVLASFGFPQAHEDDATRAIQAGLQIAAELPHLCPAAALPAGTSLAVRIGIHSGEVVTADIGRGTQSERLAIPGAHDIVKLKDTETRTYRSPGLCQPPKLVFATLGSL